MAYEKYINEQVYALVLDYHNQSSGYINVIRSNFDSFSYDEKVFFLDLIHDLEELIINCKLYFEEYSRYYKRNNEQNVYRVIQDDTLISIANKFFKDPTKWVDIYYLNKLVDFDISNQQTLLIPTLNEVDDE